MTASADPLAEYTQDDHQVQFVGGPLDGKVGISPGRRSFWSYLHDDGTKAGRDDFSRAPNPHGYVHWCGRDIDTGDPLHAYVHGSAIEGWVERADARIERGDDRD